jgi:signal transduction histidine kinase
VIVSHFVSLRSRLLAVVALAIAPFLLYGALHALRGRSTVSPAVQSATVARARATAAHVDEQLKLVDQLLDSAMAQVRRPGRQLRAPQLSDSLNRSLASTLTIAVLDASGRRAALVVGDGARIDGIPLARRTVAVGTAIGSARRRAAGATGSATFVDEGDTRADNDSIALIIVRPITRSGTRCDCLADAPGAVMAVLSDRTVQHLIGGDTLSSGALAVMTGSVGARLGRPSLATGWTGRDTRDSAVLASSVLREGVVQVEGDDGVRRLFGFSALARLPWRVYIGAPVTAAAAAPAHLFRDLLLLSLLAAVIAVVGIMLATRTVTHAPLQQLLTDTRYMAAGAITHRTDVARRGGEVGELADLINTLVAELETLRRRIEIETRRTQAATDRALEANARPAVTPAARPVPVPSPVAAPRAVAPAAQLSAAIDHADQVAFAGQLADDLDTIMQGIAGFTQLALDSADDPDMRNIAVERIRDLATNGLAMARQMQAYGERDVLQLQILDANETLTAAVESMAETLGSDVELNALYNVAPAVVRADQRLLQQAVTALLANARDAMPAGGTLTVATTFVEVPVHAREPYAAPPGEYIVVTIADTGMGMSPDAQRRMFEPFFTTKSQHGAGSGLGLAAVAGIAREHGWTISVESELRVGTAVSLYMPVSAVLPAPSAPVPQSVRDTEPARSV